jgi:PKD repeat protein
MVKQILMVLGLFLFAFTSIETVEAETFLKAEESYVTTDDIVRDILSPIIDKRLIKEYGNDASSWLWQRIVGITYNDNNSYDVSVRVQTPYPKTDNSREDLVKVRIYPFCDSEKINKLKCPHGLKLEIVEFKHISK